MLRKCKLLLVLFVRNSQAVAAFGTTTSQYFATVLGAHSFTEAMLVDSSSSGWLISPFHFMMILSIFKIDFQKERKSKFICAK